MEAQTFNPFTALGLSASVVERARSGELVKLAEAAYRGLARIYHPDPQAKEASDSRFTEITAAYEIIRDEPALRETFRQNIIRANAIQREMEGMRQEFKALATLEGGALLYLHELTLKFGSLHDYQKSISGAVFQLNRNCTALGEANEDRSRRVEHAVAKITPDGLLMMKENRRPWVPFPHRMIVGVFPGFYPLGVGVQTDDRGVLIFREPGSGRDSNFQMEKHVPIQQIEQLNPRHAAILALARTIDDTDRWMTPSEFAILAPYMRTDRPHLRYDWQVVSIDLSEDRARFRIEGANYFNRTTEWSG
jgi:curved DNA-binding protein CbpA